MFLDLLKDCFYIEEFTSGSRSYLFIYNNFVFSFCFERQELESIIIFYLSDTTLYQTDSYFTIWEGEKELFSDDEIKEFHGKDVEEDVYWRFIISNLLKNNNNAEHFCCTRDKGFIFNNLPDAFKEILLFNLDEFKKMPEV